MTQLEKLNAYLKSLDRHRPQLLMVKMGKDGQPEWWSPQGVVMGAHQESVPFDMSNGVIGPIRSSCVVPKSADTGDCNPSESAK